MTNLEALQIKQRSDLRLFVLNQALDVVFLENKTMAVSDAVAKLVTEFDAATDAIAARIQTLINTSPTLSTDDSAALQAEVTKLQALGADPANPVPAS